MTTSSLNYALLGIKKHYGADVPVTIDIKIKAVEDFHVKEADATMQALSTVDVKFFVHTVEKTELAVELEVGQILTNFTVTIGEDMTLRGNITALNVGSIVDNYCSYGSVHVDLLRNLIDDFLDPKSDVIPTLNEYIANHIVLHLPDQFGGVFKLSELTIQYHDDYVFLGATPTFIMPSVD